MEAVNTAEIIAEMRANPALADELRAVLLSAELLDLPRRVHELDARVAALDARVAARLEALGDRLETLGELMMSIGTKLEHLADRADRQERDMSALKGIGLEQKVMRSLRGVLAKLVDRPRPLDPAAIDEIADRAVAAGMGYAEASDLSLADVVARGRLRDDGGEVIVVMEVSWRLDDSDLARVLRRTAVVSKAGLHPLGVVVDHDEPRSQELPMSLAAAGIRRVTLRERISIS